jgi:hypothetical protein
MYLTQTQFLRLKFIDEAARYNRAILASIYQDAVKLLHPDVSDELLEDMIFSGVSLDTTIKRMGATVEADND